MIDIYAYATPNSLKVPLALELLGLPYALHSINVRQGAQKQPDFLALNPNAKVPVIVDHDAEGGQLVLTESAAILVYLAEKTGQLLPTSGAARARVFEQLFFHASALSPAFGNAGYFQRAAPEPIPLAIERFKGEADRLLGLLDGVLSRHEFVAGPALSIADLAHFGWLWRRAFVGVDFVGKPHLARWYAQLDALAPIQRAIQRVEALVTP